MIGKILQIAGLLIIFTGVFVGVKVGNSLDASVDDNLAISIFFAWTGSGVVSGLLLIGVGEIIHLLKSFTVNGSEH